MEDEDISEELKKAYKVIISQAKQISDLRQHLRQQHRYSRKQILYIGMVSEQEAELEKEMRDKSWEWYLTNSPDFVFQLSKLKPGPEFRQAYEGTWELPDDGKNDN